MAVHSEGLIADKGSVKEIFANPLSKTAQVFIKHNSDLSKFDYLGGGGGI